MADTQIKGTLSADESISGSLTANKGINASLTPDEEVSGALEVKRTRSIPTNLDDLGDVNITSPQDGQVMKYNGLTDEWENVNDEDSGVWGSITGTLSDQTDLQNALDAKIPSTEKGSNNGVATLDATGRVPSSQLPSFVDDVLEYASLSAFPATGEAGKIYVALDTNKMYRWSGSTYVEISESLALGETTGTAYEGSKGKANADAIAKAYKTDDAAETAIADNDYFPFYDTSATAKRKTLWSNIKAKLKAYFDGIYSTFSGSYNDLEDKPTIYKKGVYYGTCTSQAANQTKAVTIAAAQGFALEAGATIYVKFDANNTYSATAAAPVKLNVNNTGAKNVYFGGSSAPTGTNTTAFGRANYINQYIYDGTYWVWTGSSADNNTTYSAMSVSELTTGTATTSRTVRADYLKSGINSLIDTKMATLATVATSGSYSDLINEPTNQSAQQYSQTTSLCTRHEKYLWNYAYNSALKWFSGSALTGATSVLITIGVLSDYGLDGKIVAMLADNGTNKPAKWNTAEIIVGSGGVPDSIYITFSALAYDTTFDIGLL